MITSFEKEPYRFLSNFFPSPIMWANGEFPTVEHAYQASKATNQADLEMVQMAHTPGGAKRLGRKIKCRSDWQDVKVGVMTELLALKFWPGSALAIELLKTGDQQLVEGNYWGDTFWGVCRGQGQNMLGQLLMMTRANLRDWRPS